MMFGASNVRVPAEGWTPAGFDPASVKTKPLVTTANVSAANAIQTRSFWLLWIGAVLQRHRRHRHPRAGRPMIQDFFREDGTSAVAVAAAAGFVGLLSLVNMAGRFVWSSTSDLIGPQAHLHGLPRRRHDLYTLLALSAPHRRCSCCSPA